MTCIILNIYRDVFGNNVIEFDSAKDFTAGKSRREIARSKEDVAWMLDFLFSQLELDGGFNIDLPKPDQVKPATAK